MRVDSDGYGSKLNQGTAGFSPGFLLPGLHVGVTLFLTHSQIMALNESARKGDPFNLRGLEALGCTCSRATVSGVGLGVLLGFRARPFQHQPQNEVPSDQWKFAEMEG